VATQTDYHAHFRRRDRVLHGVVRRVGPFTLKPSRDRFGMLVRSIISQQISISAARSIRARLEALVGPAGLRPELLAALRIDQLRAVGLSPQKASYMHDLAAKVQDGTVSLVRLSRRSDEEIIENLTQVKGIGRWTAQMFLIFALGRPDIFPLDDFGVRSAITSLYQLDAAASKSAFQEIGSRWSPYASIGSWYCWRYLDLCKSEAAASKGYPV